MRLEPTHAALNNAVCPRDCLKSEVSIMFRFQLCSTCYIAVWINSCLKSFFAMKVTAMGNFHCEKKLSFATTKLTLFAVSKELDTKEDTVKSIKNALYVLRYTKKAPLVLNNEKIEPIYLAIHKLCWSECIR